MAERDSYDPSIEILQIGGLNERPSPNALPFPQMDVLHGMYPGRDGLMQRMNGTGFIMSLGTAVWNIAKLDDGTENVVVQTSDGTERIITLSEIFGRSGAASDLVISGGGATVEDLYPSALIVHEEAQGTDGGAIGGALNTWYTWKLTANPANESTIVTTFRDYLAGANPSTFDLDAGTYRIEACAVVCMSFNILNEDFRTCTITVAAPAVVTNIAHGLAAGDAFYFETSGTLPAPLSTNTNYYVIAAGLTADTFSFSTTVGGAAVATTAAGTGAIFIRSSTKEATAVAVLYDETNSTQIGVFQPVAMSGRNQSIGGNPNFPTARQATMILNTAFTASGAARYSIQVAGNSTSKTPWVANTNARGQTHSVTTAIGGGAVNNRYLSLKITKET